MRDGGRGPFRGGPSFAPVKEGEELDVKIESVGEKGDGIAKVKGFVLFVPGTKAGEEVKVKVTKVLRKMGFAEVVGKAEGPVEEEAPEAEAAPAEEKSSEEPQESTEDSENF